MNNGSWSMRKFLPEVLLIKTSISPLANECLTVSAKARTLSISVKSTVNDERLQPSDSFCSVLFALSASSVFLDAIMWHRVNRA